MRPLVLRLAVIALCSTSAPAQVLDTPFRYRGRTTEQWSKDLSSEDTKVLQAAISALILLPDADERAIATLLARTQDLTTPLRLGVPALKRFGAAADEASLVKLLSRPLFDRLEEAAELARTHAKARADLLKTPKHITSFRGNTRPARKNEERGGTVTASSPHSPESRSLPTLMTGSYLPFYRCEETRPSPILTSARRAS
ncbi:MAG: hypothetical protein AAF517_18640 [Planctomycetota bacterium]